MNDPLRLFEATGIEIEYAIVDAASLDIRPVADRLLEAAAGTPTGDVDRGDISWSNELALHVLELKTARPATDLAPLPSAFASNVREANRVLAQLDARLMPGAMHPWMDPLRESRLWPHEYNDVYRAFDRIFGCSGHGWTNLQSVHINLPFAGDDEFHRLHAAIRLVLPLTPAIAASSPFVEGRADGALDRRLVAYASNSRRIPSVAGLIVPEPVSSRDAYERNILSRIYRDLAPHDSDGVLRHEWANARGAIARFERGSIEIRTLDTQEAPTADLALAAGVVDVVRLVATEVDPHDADRIPTEALASLLDAAIRDGDRAKLSDRRLIELLGLRGNPTTAGAWERLLGRAAGPSGQPPFVGALERILARGPLARRILRAAGADPAPARLRTVYRRLCECLAEDTPFS